ncbi:unnamed protein product [Adineta ricciae]|uniref:Pyridoxal kinase n=1 Tax=Adineta ricciae TaxID=249248 RepID=A0A816DE37_ADIRI|nr:unnamed protein product [Adineta ricciae]
MLRSSFLMLCFLTILFISSTYEKNVTSRKRPHTSRHKPASIKLCGPTLVRMLDMVCDRARQLLMKTQRSSSDSTYQKRQMIVDDDPFTRTLSVTDYAQFNNTLVGDCCLQACSLEQYESHRIPRVLSIQSHVVHGFVGNKCAAFILQLYGFEVDIINSVHFSNHTGYKTVKGSRLTADELEAIFQGLLINELLEYDYILTGYMGSGELLHVVAKYVRLIKSKSAHIKYICDPVIGDNNKLYVDRSCIEVYKNEILPLADIVTPNDFEIEVLIGKELDYKNDENQEEVIWQSLRSLHKMGPSHIIISSISADKTGGNQTMLQMRASTQFLDNQYQTFQIDFPHLEGSFTGTGDSFSALILAWFHKENNLIRACERSISILHQILRKTIEISKPINTHNRCGHELCLIESKAIIECGEILFHAVLNDKHLSS